MVRKTLFVILDGLGDLPCKELDGETPLGAAFKPNLDAIARKGVVGSVKIAKNLAPESDVGVLSLLGFNPFKTRVGRGYLEAIGSGLGFSNGCLALRANFATGDEKGDGIIDRRVGRNLSSEKAKALAWELNKKVRLEFANFEFKSTIAHRAAVVFKLKKKVAGVAALSHRITNTDPAYVIGKGGVGHALEHFEMKVQKAVPWKEASGDNKAKIAAHVVNEFTRAAHAILQKSKVNLKRIRSGKKPANIIICRDAESSIPRLKPFKNWGIIAEYPLEVGIGKSLKMKVLPAMPGTAMSDYKKRALVALAALKRFDGVYVHLKGPDLFGHDGDAIGKTTCIEEIDNGFFKLISEKFDFKEDRLIVTGDHSTPCSVRGHSNDLVPLLAAGTDIQPNGVKFEDIAARKSKLKLDGWNVLKKFKAKK